MAGADIVTTLWEQDHAHNKLAAMAPYPMKRLMGEAKTSALFLHCLPRIAAKRWSMR